MSEFASSFLVFSRLVIHEVLRFWHISAILTLNLVAAVTRTHRSEAKATPMEYGRLALLFVAVPAMIAVGALGRVEQFPPSAPETNMVAMYFSIAIFIATVLSGIYLVVKMRRQRWMVISVILLVLWLTFWATFYTNMAITGKWL